MLLDVHGICLFGRLHASRLAGIPINRSIIL